MSGKRWDNKTGSFVEEETTKPERTFTRKKWHDEENDTYHERISYPSLSYVEEFVVSEMGLIRNPGRFEGERTYVPYYWQETLDGGCDEEYVGEVPYYVIEVEPKDRFIFDIPQEVTIVVLWQSNDGFVMGTGYASAEEWAEALEIARTEASYDEEEEETEFELVKGLDANTEQWKKDNQK